MKKILLTGLLGVIIATTAIAQKGDNKIGAGVDIGLPVGNFSTAYGVGLGISVKGLYGVGDAGHVTLTTGYSSFGGKSGFYNDYKFHIIPVLAGYRHSFNGPYVEPQLGISNLTTKVSGYKFSETKFTWAIGGGYEIKSFDIGLRYQSAAELGQIALRLAYNFMLGAGK